MKRITVSVTDEIAVAVERAAHRAHTSVSDLTRQALTAHLKLKGSRGEGTVPFASLGRSGLKSLGRDSEEILNREWRR